MRRLIFNAMVFASIALISVGCVQTLAIGVLTGFGEVFRYSRGNIARRTFTESADNVVSASTRALILMDLKTHRVKRLENEIEIVASAEELNIEIEISSITPKVTRVSVNTYNALMIKDKATAVEIVAQISKCLAEPRFKRSETDDRRTYRVKKGDCPYLIAKDHGLSLETFLRLNALTPHSIIYPGQVMQVE